MADIRIGVTGDASSAKQALNETSDAIGKSTAKWGELANAAKAAASAVMGFLKDSTEAYMESERVQRQLTRAAGDYADALGRQAEAISQQLNVDDELIKQMETLLVQWGGVGAASEETTRAILDYAAASGTDALSATKEFINAVEKGDAKLVKYGVSFEQTGDRATDLKRATDALTGALGGSAAANAQSLSGQLEGASVALGNLKEDIGESIAGFLQETGAIAATTEALKGLSEFITQKHTQALLDQQLKSADLKNATNELALAQQALKEAMADPNVSLTVLEQFSDDVTRAQEKLKALRGEIKAVVTVDGRTSWGKAQDAKKDSVELTKKYVQEETEAVRDGMAEQSALIQQQNEEALAADREMYAEALKLQKEASDSEAKMALDSWRQQSEIKKAEQEKMRRDEEESEKKSLDETKRRMESEEKAWKSAGDQIGAAFVNGLSDQLQKLAAGEEFDAAIFVGDILASVISVAATVIGSAYGQPALGAAVGNLAAMGVRAGAGAISAGNKKRNSAKKYHQGGLITQHDNLEGDEVPMVGLEGEYVATRQEVARAGGPQGMKQLLSGGPRVVVNVSALDALSAARSFIGDVGEGLKQAVRSGQGAVPALLGVNPR